MRRAVTSLIVLVAAASVSGGLLAGEAAGQEGSGLGLPRGGQARQFAPVPQLPFGLYSSRPSQDVAPPYPYLYPGPAFPYGYGGYYGVPWFVPQTRKYKSAVLLNQYEYPKLGLQYLYPYAYQFGIQMPPETDEPVAAPRSGLMAQETQEGRGAPAKEYSRAVALMKQGRYADAGRILAGELRDEAAPPELYLLITETLWAAGKPKDADIVLRQAIDVARNLDFLDRADLTGKFPSREALNEKLTALDTGTEAALLVGTMNILAGSREKGLAVLREVAPQDTAARRVYIHFLGSAFGEAASSPLVPPEGTPPSPLVPPEGTKTPPAPPPPAPKAPEKKA
jgi:hypothetical protein